MNARLAAFCIWVKKLHARNAQVRDCKLIFYIEFDQFQFENKYVNGSLFQTIRSCEDECIAYNVGELSERICCLTDLCNHDIERGEKLC